MIIKNSIHNTCFFRTIDLPNYKKSLIQITERCNLRCSHCFVSAENTGISITLDNIKELIIPRLKLCNVRKVTITGGEPFVHPQLIDIVTELIKNNFLVTICSNGTLISNSDIHYLSKLKKVKLNISLDGFRKKSFENFRNATGIFDTVIENIILLSQKKLIKGILVTPNNLSEEIEYIELCYFAKEHKIPYVLMNPLSRFGRGVNAISTLGTTNETNLRIRKATEHLIDKNFDITYIRFPNINKKPLGPCIAGKIIYIFANGDVTYCPYLVFASRSTINSCNNNQFILGNMFKDSEICDKIRNFNIDSVIKTEYTKECSSCPIVNDCMLRCPAAYLVNKNNLNKIDLDLCPYREEVTNEIIT